MKPKEKARRHEQGDDGHTSDQTNIARSRLGVHLPEVAARDYVQRGWAPIPVPRGEKGPRLPGWPDFRCEPNEIDEMFVDMNVGIILGERSGGLVDVDLDCPEAEALAPRILPPTDAVFGRKSKPQSHYFYQSGQTAKTRRFCDENGSTLAEIRSTGSQTVSPGSMHPSGEDIVWAKGGDPATVDAGELESRVALLAAASLLAQRWPSQGCRQDAAIALAGGLQRSGVDANQIPRLVEAIAITASDDESASRCGGAEATIAKGNAGDAVTGWPRLGELIGEEPVNRCRKWLGDRGLIGGGPASQPGRAGSDGYAARRRAGRRKSHAAVMFDYAIDTVDEFFHDGETSYATLIIERNGRSHQENHAIRSKPFTDWLRLRAFEILRTPLGGRAMQNVIDLLDAKTLAYGPEIPTALRVARSGNAIFVDLCDEAWGAVEITPMGWQVVPSPQVKFLRRGGMLSLPTPVRGGSLDELRRFLNVGDDANWQLIVSWMLMALKPTGPYPVLAISGERGTCKSNASRILRQAIDPSRVPDRTESRNPEDLTIAAENAWVLALDNVSSLKSWLSDGLCRIATGGGFGTRELYAARGETLFFTTRPVLLNGIGAIATRSDLVDRCLCVTLPTVEPKDRRTVEDLWRDFQITQPRISGALYDAVASALANLESVTITTLPRMADFARWIAAAEPALGWQPGEFMKTYAQNANVASQGVLDATPVATVLLRFVRTRGRWCGSASELLAELHRMHGVDANVKRGGQWPSSAANLGSLLSRLAPAMRATGYAIEYRRTGNGRRWELAAPGHQP